MDKEVIACGIIITYLVSHKGVVIVNLLSTKACTMLPQIIALNISDPCRYNKGNYNTAVEEDSKSSSSSGTDWSQGQ